MKKITTILFVTLLLVLGTSCKKDSSFKPKSQTLEIITKSPWTLAVTDSKLRSFPMNVGFFSSTQFDDSCSIDNVYSFTSNQMMESGNKLCSYENYVFMFSLINDTQIKIGLNHYQINEISEHKLKISTSFSKNDSLFITFTR